MTWDANRLSLYLDGKQMNTIDVAKAAQSGVPNPFRQPVFMILNQAIGGANGGDPSKTKFPLRYEVDYVRAYQGSPSPGPGPGPAPSPAPGTQAACQKHCAGQGAAGCCQWVKASAHCAWAFGGWVNGGHSAPGSAAANCHAGGKCDGWNDSEDCHQAAGAGEA